MSKFKVGDLLVTNEDHRTITRVLDPWILGEQEEKQYLVHTIKEVGSMSYRTAYDYLTLSQIKNRFVAPFLKPGYIIFSNQSNFVLVDSETFSKV